jgi:hypothetical protein
MIILTKIIKTTNETSQRIELGKRAKKSNQRE